MALLLGACQATGPAADPITRVFTWFDYVGGEDLRRGCQPGTADRWRLVYNGIWTEQVRTYELRAMPPVLEAQVFSGALDAHYSGDGFATGWLGRSARWHLRPAEFEALADAFSGPWPTPAPPGTFLRSDDFYFAVSGCVGGVFRFAAWARDTPGFDRLPFFGALDRYAVEGRPVNPPRRLDLPPFAKVSTQNRGRGYDGPAPFRLQVGENGLRRGL